MEGQEPVRFLFQWEIERLYKQGSPSANSHRLTVEARTVPPSSPSGPVPIQRKDGKGRVFFDGNFRLGPVEKRVGQLDPQLAEKSEKPTLKNATTARTCMPQPRLNLAPAQ